MLYIIGKVASILAIVAIGVILYKTKRLGDQACTDLTTLLLTVTSPCLVLYTLYEKELTADTLAASAQAFLGCAGYILVASILSYIMAKLLRIKKGDAGCYMVLTTALNNGFMGFPIAREIFGSDVLYLFVIHNIFMNFYFYSIAVMELNSGRGFKVKDMLKSLCSPIMLFMLIGVIMLCFNYQPPEVIDDLIRLLGDATVPLSMLVVGLQLGKSNFKHIMENRQLIIMSLFAMVAIPVITFLIVNPLPLYTDVKTIIVFATVFPSAVVPVALAEKYNSNAKLMAEGVTLTTVLSMITIPVGAILLTAYYY